MTNETPIRFFHKKTGKRLVAVKSYGLLCGDETNPSKCALFGMVCYGICFEVRDIVGYEVYFNEILD